MKDADGVHGEVRIGDSMMMIGGGVAQKEFPATLHPNALHVYVQDADAVCKNAVQAGATLVDETAAIRNTASAPPRVKDAAGNFWYIATHKGESYVPQGSAQCESVSASAAGRTTTSAF